MMHRSIGQGRGEIMQVAMLRPLSGNVYPEGEASAAIRYEDVAGQVYTGVDLPLAPQTD